MKNTAKKPLKNTTCKCHIRPKTKANFHLDRTKKDGFAGKCKSCRLSNKENWYGRQRIYQKEKYHSDKQFNISTKIRQRIKGCLRTNNIPKSNSTRNLLGCSWDEFKSWIESKFTKGMNWGLIESGDIHIDHIIPINFFNLTNNIELSRAFHFTNTCPMWASDNLKKGDKILINGKEVKYETARTAGNDTKIEIHFSYTDNRKDNTEND